MTKTITTEKLQSLRKGTGGFLLIDVTSKESFDKDHIPGARSVPLDCVDFAGAVAEKASGSKARKVVLYASGPDSDQSSKAAKKLATNGFTDVVDYAGGLSAWNESKRARLARTAKLA